MPCLGKAHKSAIELPERRRTEVIRVESWNGGMAVLRFGTFDGDTTKLTENSSFAWCPAPVRLDVLLLTEFQSVEIQKCVWNRTRPQSARAESAHKGVNLLVQQQRPESPTPGNSHLDACKYKVHKLHQRYRSRLRSLLLYLCYMFLSIEIQIGVFCMDVYRSMVFCSWL